MDNYISAEHHPAFEEYCETIFELAEDGTKVIQARISERLGVSRPAVSEMIKKMVAEGLITLEKSEIVLTEDGSELANVMVRRHRIAERFLTDILGLSWAQAHHEAGKWEHVISPDVEEALAAKLENPTTCPHGNPIPGTEYEAPDMVQLSTVAAGENAVITRIPEELEFTPGMLEFLETNQLLPGASVAITTNAPDGATTLAIGEATVDISAFCAERILVQVAIEA